MSQDINGAFNHYAHPNQPISSNIVGKTVPEVTAQDGSKMFDPGEWLVKERSFETSVARIIVFSGLLFFLIGLFVGIYVKKNDPKYFNFGGKMYVITGVGEFNDGNRKIYTPVYEVKK